MKLGVFTTLISRTEDVEKTAGFLKPLIIGETVGEI